MVQQKTSCVIRLLAHSDAMRERSMEFLEACLDDRKMNMHSMTNATY